MSGRSPISCASAPNPMPSACTPMRLISCGNSQRASYSRKPVGFTSGKDSNSKVLAASAGLGCGNMVARGEGKRGGRGGAGIADIGPRGNGGGRELARAFAGLSFPNLASQAQPCVASDGGALFAVAPAAGGPEMRAFGLRLVLLAAFAAPLAVEAETLKVVEVNAPAVNCVFRPAAGSR